jgi:predicted lactoylglutathione lyase
MNSVKQIFINLPVNDLEKSLQFYLALGFSLNPLFTDEHQKCVIWSDHIYLMLQSTKFSSDYLKRPVENTIKTISVSHTLPVEAVEKFKNQNRKNDKKNHLLGANCIGGIYFHR